jgi:hypothetical protein
MNRVAIAAFNRFGRIRTRLSSPVDLTFSLVEAGTVGLTHSE